MFLAAVILYLLVSMILINLAKRFASKYDLNPKYWGRAGWLVMLLIPFWDWLPTIAVHHYACATQAGFWNYKTLDLWKRENPGVFETLAVDHLPSEYRVKSGFIDEYVLPDGTVLKAEHNRPTSVNLKRPDGSYGKRLNERFSVITYAKQPIPGLVTTVYTNLLMDTETNEILAKGVNVESRTGNFSVDPKTARFLPSLKSCGSDVWNVTREIRNMSLRNARK
jgi:hypothetical protein